MNIVLRITRQEAGEGKKPFTQDFTLQVEPTDRVLDALMAVKGEQDGTLSFRKSCGHGVCGSDAMVINGTERLACKTLIRDVAPADGAVITIAPLRFLPVQRDLMVDQGEFFRKFRSVSPFLITDQPASGGERLQSPEQRAAFDDATSCILCGACYSSCPVFEKNPSYVGPAAIVNAARFTFDSRDTGLAQRLPALDTPDGVWACENHFNCTRVCPREIKITKNINQTKRAITKHKEGKS
jgi:succinate dehydrogenase / fumarate reductase, iron-sulfur subunit